MKHTAKEELSAEDLKALSVSSDKVIFDMTKYVRQYYLEDIDPTAPINLIFRYYESTFELTQGPS